MPTRSLSSARRATGRALLALGALAAGPAWSAPPAVRLSAERSEVPDQHSAAALADGRAGPAAVALCERAADGLQVCLRVKDGERWRLVTEEDAARWGEAPAAVRERAIRAAAKAWAARPPQPATVEGMPGRYFLRQGDDAAEALALLEPKRLEDAAGTSDLVVAFPERGTLLFWTPGAADFDKVVAVGARRIAESVADPLSAWIYRHEAGKWLVWAEVRGEVEPRVDAPPAPTARPALPPGVEAR
ncbi:MAG: hypothetical protein JNM72_06540 [Deltaproteobacteria bacterium]|nr:hypothetical protein [Deltaproteobacteria bacterium]